MKVLSFRAHNVLRLKDVEINLEGRNIFTVGGRNGQGKSSTLKALLMALCGRSGMNFPEPALREGETEGWVEVKLSGSEELHEPNGFTVRLKFVKKRDKTVVETLTILDSAGEEAPEPRQFLRRLYQMRGFDPLEFTRMKRAEQRAVLCRLLGIDLDSLKAEREEYYSERRVVNKQGVAAKALAEAMPIHPDAPAEPVKVSELADRLTAARESNRQLNELTREVTAMMKSCNDKANTIAEMLATVDRLRAELEVDEAVLKLKGDTMSSLETINTKSIEAEIAAADEVNAKVAANQAREKAFRDLESLRKQSMDLTDKIAEVDERQQKMIAEANWPIPGMSVDEEGVLVNDLPLENASRSQQVTISTEIGIMQNPELKLFISENGSDLDSETIVALDEILGARGYQMIVEVVTRTAADDEMCAIVIKDGEVEKFAPAMPENLILG
jgi:DNA repair exonuclease SbcCD ATPase subunit